MARGNQLRREDNFDPGHPATTRIPNHQPDSFHEWLSPVEDGLDVPSLRLKKGRVPFFNVRHQPHVGESAACLG